MGLGTSFLSGAATSAAGALSSVLPTGLGALLQQLIAHWQSDSRLYTLVSPSTERPLPADLMVERFVLTDAVSEPSSLTLHALLLDANVEL